jgi:Fuc2NAc and GlcNAc transferase
MSSLPIIIFAFAFSFLLTGLATWYARRRGLMDHPGARHSHNVATPRGGGAGLVAALLLTTGFVALSQQVSFWSVCVMPGAAVLAVTGWRDDHSSLSALLRLFIQLAVSFYLLTCVQYSGWMQGAIPMILTGIAVVWMTNLYNFMDGSNGMAGLQGVFAATVLAWLFHLAGDAAFSLICLLVAASCAGFLPWNLGRARVFMGDVGSVTLGFIFAAMLVYGGVTHAFSLPVALLVMVVFLMDSTLTLVVRVLRGERWYNAHRQHLYQQLIEYGWAHGRVALFYQTINLTLVLPGIVVAAKFPELAWPVLTVLSLGLILAWYRLNKKIGVFTEAG